MGSPAPSRQREGKPAAGRPLIYLEGQALRLRLHNCDPNEGSLWSAGWEPIGSDCSYEADGESWSMRVRQLSMPSIRC